MFYEALVCVAAFMDTILVATITIAMWFTNTIASASNDDLIVMYTPATYATRAAPVNYTTTISAVSAAAAATVFGASATIVAKTTAASSAAVVTLSTIWPVAPPSSYFEKTT